MTPEQFCYWLQGRAELQPEIAPSAAEWQMMREHLATVFEKVTPPLRQYQPRSPTAVTPSADFYAGKYCGAPLSQC